MNAIVPNCVQTRMWEENSLDRELFSTQITQHTICTVHMKHTELSTQQICMALQYTTLRWTVAHHWTSKITAEPGNQTG